MPHTPTHFDITQQFDPGARGPGVQELQRFLNRAGFPVAQTGPGAPGFETQFFGPLTQQALQQFQSAQGIVARGTPTTTGFGRLGPSTLRAIQQFQFPAGGAGAPGGLGGIAERLREIQEQLPGIGEAIGRLGQQPPPGAPEGLQPIEPLPPGALIPPIQQEPLPGEPVRPPGEGIPEPPPEVPVEPPPEAPPEGLTQEEIVARRDELTKQIGIPPSIAAKLDLNVLEEIAAALPRETEAERQARSEREAALIRISNLEEVLAKKKQPSEEDEALRQQVLSLQQELRDLTPARFLETQPGLRGVGITQAFLRRRVAQEKEPIAAALGDLLLSQSFLAGEREREIRGIEADIRREQRGIEIEEDIRALQPEPFELPTAIQSEILRRQLFPEEPEEAKELTPSQLRLFPGRPVGTTIEDVRGEVPTFPAAALTAGERRVPDFETGRQFISDNVAASREELKSVLQERTELTDGEINSLLDSAGVIEEKTLLTQTQVNDIAVALVKANTKFARGGEVERAREQVRAGVININKKQVQLSRRQIDAILSAIDAQFPGGGRTLGQRLAPFGR